MRMTVSAFGLWLAAAGVAVADGEVRLTPREIAAEAKGGPGAGTSGVAGIRTTLLSGDPTKAGLYTIRLSIPAKTTIQAHTHRDNRSAVVVSGTWFFGYGAAASKSTTKALMPGSFYTEPAGVAHFARTASQPVIIYITGFGPTDTVYTDPANEPHGK